MRPVYFPQQSTTLGPDRTIQSLTQNYFAPVAAAATGVTTSGGPYNGAVPLNGSLVVAGVAVFDVARQVTVTSAGNDSGITFTIRGTGTTGQSIVEVLTGANIGTATTVRAFSTVTSITTSAITASTITVGTGAVANSPPIPIPVDGYSSTTINAVVSGTVNYTVQQTFDNPFVPDPDVQCRWYQVVAALTAATTTQNSNTIATAMAYRLTVNSNTPPGGVQLEVLTTIEAINL